MTNAACTNPNSYNQQIALNNWADYLLCSKCKRVYWNDMDDDKNVNDIDIHPFWGNSFINLMARTGRKDLVEKEKEKFIKEREKTMEQMKQDMIKKMESEEK